MDKIIREFGRWTDQNKQTIFDNKTLLTDRLHVIADQCAVQVSETENSAASTDEKPTSGPHKSLKGT